MPILVPLEHPLDPARYGTKAAQLARARAHGLDTQAGLVLGVEVHAAARSRGGRLDPTLVSALGPALAALGAGPYVVRTSAADEDQPGHSSAGLYSSELGCLDAQAVAAAIERCWAGAHSERIAVYREATGQSAPHRLPDVAILVQPQLTARWAGVLFTRDPRIGPDAPVALVELVPESTTLVTAGLVNPHRTRISRTGPPWPELPPQTPVAGLAQRLAALADLAEEIVGGPADVELALSADDRLVVLQLRPITAFAAAPIPPSPAPTEGDDALTWTWDRDHNPDPLSPLHASLIAHLDGRAALPFRLKTVNGFLYTAPRGEPRPATPDAAAGRWQKQRLHLDALVRELEALESTAVELPVLLERFADFYESYAAVDLKASHHTWARQLGAALAEGALDRKGASDALAGVQTPLTSGLRELAALAAPHPELVAQLRAGLPTAQLGCSEFESAFGALMESAGALSPAWDLAAPTLAEDPAGLRIAIAQLTELPVGMTGDPDAVDPRRRNLGADEEDDLIFARALATLRRFCLRAGATLQGRGVMDRAEDIFWLDFDRLKELLASPARADQRPRIAAARKPGAPLDPPVILRGGEEIHVPGPAPGEVVLRGVGCGGGTALGKAQVVRRPGLRGWTAGTSGTARIVVCATLLPSMVPLLIGAAGVVTDHGGLLSHGAILARELGVPAVLGISGASRHISTGELLWLDGDHGVVIRLHP
ncbi:MAG: PEP/pyruvate-binding domain-containing protein [bacterium]